jgi:hypothetical protein
MNADTHPGIPPEQTFSGQSLPKEAQPIKRLVKLTGAHTFLDYGSGEGSSTGRCASATRQKESNIPTSGRSGAWPISDGVICTDVLEHCREEDVRWILAELFAFASKFVYANVACWWEEQLAQPAASKPELRYEFRLAYAKARDIKTKILQR